MSNIEVGAYALGILVFLIMVGLPIALSMFAVSFAGVWMIRNDAVAMRMIGSVANDSIEEYLYAVVPLFILMGLLVTLSGMGRDTFALFERLLRRVTAGLGVATVASNAVFASITGISIASASVFSRIAVPEMVRHGYNRRFATGVIAGSSVLGMLLPPSLLLDCLCHPSRRIRGPHVLGGHRARDPAVDHLRGHDYWYGKVPPCHGV